MLAMTFKLGITVDVDVIYTRARFGDLDLDNMSQLVGRLKKLSVLNYLDIKTSDMH